MLRYLAKRALTYAFMIFLTTTAGYFLAVNTLQPALLEQEHPPIGLIEVAGRRRAWLIGLGT